MDQEKFLKLVGDNIKRIRMKRGLNARTLADRMGVPVGSVEMIEKGLVLTSLVDIYEISSVLEVDPVELFR